MFAKWFSGTINQRGFSFTKSEKKQIVPRKPSSTFARIKNICLVRDSNARTSASQILSRGLKTRVNCNVKRQDLFHVNLKKVDKSPLFRVSDEKNEPL